MKRILLQFEENFSITRIHFQLWKNTFGSRHYDLNIISIGVLFCDDVWFVVPISTHIYKHVPVTGIFLALEHKTISGSKSRNVPEFESYAKVIITIHMVIKWKSFSIDGIM